MNRVDEIRQTVECHRYKTVHAERDIRYLLRRLDRMQKALEHAVCLAEDKCYCSGCAEIRKALAEEEQNDKAEEQP